jgi:hypothetical protein
VLTPQYIQIPSTTAEWILIGYEFEKIGGFPCTCASIDRSLIEIERPFDYEGWYCRKGFPAINLQGVVDSKRNKHKQLHIFIK